MKRLKKLALVRRLQAFRIRSAQISNNTPRYRRQKAGSHTLPRCGTGARKGLSVSTSSRSSGIIFATSCKSLAIFEGHDP